MRGIIRDIVIKGAASGLSKALLKADLTRLLINAHRLGGLDQDQVDTLRDEIVERLERAEANRDHRYLHYYNLGIGTIWSEQVGDINDLIDVRTAQNEAHSFAGMQAGLWGSGDRLALGEGHWSPPQPSADSLNAGLSEWAERQSYASEEERDDPRLAAQNIGWGLGVRASWNTARVAAVLQTTKERGLWPQSLSVEDAWEGYGWGLGRARAGVSDHPDSLPPSVPEAMHEAVSRGMRDGRALGRVPEAGSQPAFASVRGSAT